MYHIPNQPLAENEVWVNMVAFVWYHVPNLPLTENEVLVNMVAFISKSSSEMFIGLKIKLCMVQCTCQDVHGDMLTFQKMKFW